MRRYGAIALAAVLCTAAVPSFAAWDRVGSVMFSMRDSHDSASGDFFGNTVTLTARDGGVSCRDVEARFDDGRARTVFRGDIPFGQTVNVAIPGGPDMHRLDFDCRPMEGWRARVDVAANTSDRDFYGQRFGYGYGRDNPVQRFLGHVFGD